MRCIVAAFKIIKTLLLIIASTGSQTIKSDGNTALYSCGDKLGFDRTKTRATLFLLETESVDKSTEFLMFAAAVIAAESGFNPGAVSPSGAIGLMQVTTVGAKEGAIQCGVKQVTTAQLKNSKTNVKIGTCLLRYYLQQAKGNHTLAIIMYNGGYKQLTRFLKDGSLSKETLEYVLRVESLYGRCQ